MNPPPVRVVYDNQPYLVTRRNDGALDRAWGPFAPGTEPSLGACSPENEVDNRELLTALNDLMPLSPSMPASDDTLAGAG